jgi:hypothetical protein
MTWDLRLYFPSGGILLPLKIYCLGRARIRSGKHTNHYITEATAVAWNFEVIGLLNTVPLFIFSYYWFILKMETSEGKWES